MAAAAVSGSTSSHHTRCARSVSLLAAQLALHVLPENEAWGCVRCVPRRSIAVTADTLYMALEMRGLVRGERVHKASKRKKGLYTKPILFVTIAR